MRSDPGRRRLGRRSLRLAALCALLALLCWVPSGCTSLVRPPEDPPDPRQVFVRHSGRHFGLILPDGRSGWVEYGYGDYDWYALRRTRWYHVFDTLLWPTRATLGRRFFPSTTRDRPATDGRARLMPVEVASARARALERELDRRYSARAAHEIHNEAFGLDFVPTEPRFWAFHNCADAVAEWLEELGCEVSWRPIRKGLRVVGEAGEPER